MKTYCFWAFLGLCWFVFLESTSYDWVGATADLPTASNWNPASVPTSSDTGLFGAVGSTTPTLSATSPVSSFQLRYLQFNNLSQAYTFNLDRNGGNIQLVGGGIDAQLSHVAQHFSINMGTLVIRDLASADINNSGLVFISTVAAPPRTAFINISAAKAGKANFSINASPISATSTLQFTLGSDAQLSTINLDANGSTLSNCRALFIGDETTANEATIIARSGALVSFGDTATAAKAYIELNKSFLNFGNGTGTKPTAASATVKSIDSSITFANSSTAENATLELDNSSLLFSNSSSGSNASVGLANASTYTINQSNMIGSVSSDALSTIQLNANNLSIGAPGSGSTVLGPVLGNSSVASITKNGIGTLILGGSNTYRGFTRINSGTVQVSSSANLGNSSYATNTIIIGGSGTLRITGSFATSRLISVGVGSTLRIDPGQTFTASGVINGASLIKQGSGTAIFSAANTYSGGTTINAGILALSGSGSLSSTGAVNVNSAASIFDISAITTGTTIGNLSGVANSSVVLGSKTLTFGTATASTTFGGIVSGVGGSLIKEGFGTAIFSAANTYSGGTTINAGTLALSGSGSLSSTGAVSVNSAASIFDISAITTGTTIGDLSGVANSSVVLGSKTLTFGTATASTTFGGIVSGVGGSLIKEGFGTAIFSAVNTYSGETTINAGTLAISGAGDLNHTGTVTVNGTFDLSLASNERTIGPLAGNGFVVMGGNQLIVNSVSSTTFSGIISGTNGFGKIGSHSLSLTGSNTFVGGITISSGTLHLSDMGAIDSSNFVNLQTGGTFDISLYTLNFPSPTAAIIDVGNVIGNGILSLGTNNLTTTTTLNSVFSGNITGSGDLTKQGPAIWQLTGNSAAYLGTTTVAMGELNLNGTLGGPVVVNSSAIFSSNGTLGPLTSSGTIKTGNENNLGTMTVNGNFTLNPGNVIHFDIEPEGQNDLIIASGNAVLQGKINVNFLPGVYIQESTYKALIAANIAGSFNEIVDNNADFNVIINYYPTFVELVLRRTKLFLGIDFTNPNAQAVADALEIINSSGGLGQDHDLNNVMITLVGQNPAVIQDALDQMQPSQMSAFSELNAQHGFNLISLIQHRSAICCQENCLGCGKKYNIWVLPYGEGFRQKPLQWQVGFDTNSLGVALGGQKSFRHTTMGIAFAYDHAKVNWHHHRGHGDVNNYYAGGYLYQQEKYCYLGLSALYGYNEYQTTRNLEFTTIHRHANSCFSGDEFIAQITTGLCFKKSVDIDPYLDVTYVGNWRSHFKEHGAESLNLKVNANSSQTMFYDAGIDFKKSYIFKTLCLTPSLKLGWLCEEPLHRKKYKSCFVYHPNSFTTKGYNKIQNFFIPGFSLTLDAKDRWSILGSYHLQVCSNFFGQNGALEIKYNF